VHKAIIARIVTRPEKSVGGFSFGFRSVAPTLWAGHTSGKVRILRAQSLRPARCQYASPPLSAALQCAASRAAAGRNPYEVRMSADIIFADFKSRTYHKPDPITLERLAAEILEQVEKAPYGGQGIDGMDLGKEPA
jgi:hypothetical protein